MNEPNPIPEEPIRDAEPGLSTAALAGREPAPAEDRAFARPNPSDGADGATRTGDRPAPLYSADEAQKLRGEWSQIQAGFVDEPRRAVEQADNLVAVAMKRLAEMFANERSSLEHQWDQGDKVSTEDLRLVLQRYRSFFDRLLSI